MNRRFWSTLWLFLTTLAAVAAPEGAFDWSKAKAVTKDILHAELTWKEPRPLKIHALKVDLTAPSLRLITTGRAPGWGETMPDCEKFVIRTKRQRTLDFVTELRKQGIPVVAAVNSSPWVPWEKPFNHKYADHIGLSVCDGEVVSLPQKRPVPALIQKRDGGVEMREVKPGDPVDDVFLAVSGFTFILREGKVCPPAKDHALHPRTFYGLSQDRKTLYLVTVDGRQKGYSEGMNLHEGGELLLHFGSYEGINMDGGGSTSMVLVRKNIPALVNLPPGTGLPRASRTVATNLGIYYTSPKVERALRNARKPAAKPAK